MPDEFTWCPQTQASGEVTHRKTEVQYGDGYSASIGDGINLKSEKWEVSFTQNATTTAAIRAFLDTRGGVQSFTWTPPSSVQGKYVSDPYTVTAIGMGFYTINVTFRQVFR